MLHVIVFNFRYRKAFLLHILRSTVGVCAFADSSGMDCTAYSIA
jgi:hypothetical protein